MKRILEILSYVSAVVHAITEGAKVANSHWPNTNPFTTNKKPDEKLEGLVNK